MKVIKHIWDKASPRSAILRSIKKEKKKHQKEWESHRDKEQRDGKIYPFNSKEYDETMRWYSAQLQEIDDNLLIKKAEKLDILLIDIPSPSDPCNIGKQYRNKHYRYDNHCSLFTLHENSRKELRQAVKQATPLYRKERRELCHLWFKGAFGIIGALAGLVAVWIKLR